jgi:hypothetical protein
MAMVIRLLAAPEVLSLMVMAGSTNGTCHKNPIIVGILLAIYRVAFENANCPENWGCLEE